LQDIQSGVRQVLHPGRCETLHLVPQINLRMTSQYSTSVLSNCRTHSLAECWGMSSRSSQALRAPPRARLPPETTSWCTRRTLRTALPPRSTPQPLPRPVTPPPSPPSAQRITAQYASCSHQRLRSRWTILHRRASGFPCDCPSARLLQGQWKGPR